MSRLLNVENSIGLSASICGSSIPRLISRSSPVSRSSALIASAFPTKISMTSRADCAVRSSRPKCSVRYASSVIGKSSLLQSVRIFVKMAFSLHNTVIIPFHMADFNAIRMDFGGSMQKQTLPKRRNVCLSNKLRLPNSLSHGCAVSDLRRSARLPPAPRATSSTPSKRELFIRLFSV